jgi:hypothetical protein
LKVINYDSLKSNFDSFELLKFFDKKIKLFNLSLFKRKNYHLIKRILSQFVIYKDNINLLKLSKKRNYFFDIKLYKFTKSSYLRYKFLASINKNNLFNKLLIISYKIKKIINNI